MPTVKPRTANTALGILCLILAGFALALHSPGHISTDTSIQLHEAFTGRIESWAPPFMSALLYWLGLGTVGTALFVLLNVASSYGALYLSARSKENGGAWSWPRLGLALALIANPVVFAYVGIVWKDVLFGVFCVLALALNHAASRCESKRATWFVSILALVVLLPIPLIRQHGTILMPIFAIGPALQIARHIPRNRRWVVVALVLIGTYAGYCGVRAMVAASFEKGPDGRDISVGTTIIKSYDLAGIQYRTGASGPLAKAGASSEVLAAIEKSYGGDRVDRLGASEPLSKYFNTLGPEQIDSLWKQAIADHPRAYIAHRFSAYAWLLDVNDTSACLPFLVGVDGIPTFLNESGLRTEMERRDTRLFEWNKHFVTTPLWRHWSYVLLLASLTVFVLLRRRALWSVYLPWLAGLILFVGSFLPTTIACDFRYLYALIPCTLALALGLLRPNDSIAAGEPAA